MCTGGAGAGAGAGDTPRRLTAPRVLLPPTTAAAEGMVPRLGRAREVEAADNGSFARLRDDGSPSWPLLVPVRYCVTVERRPRSSQTTAGKADGGTFTLPAPSDAMLLMYSATPSCAWTLDKLGINSNCESRPTTKISATTQHTTKAQRQSNKPTRNQSAHRSLPMPDGLPMVARTPTECCNVLVQQAIVGDIFDQVLEQLKGVCRQALDSPKVQQRTRAQWPIRTFVTQQRHNGGCSHRPATQFSPHPQSSRRRGIEWPSLG